jgi:hypothetical protein
MMPMTTEKKTEKVTMTMTMTMTMTRLPSSVTPWT